MNIINVTVASKIAITKNNPLIVCDNTDYVIYFNFDSEWDNYQQKTARFTYFYNGAKCYKEVVFAGTSCSVPNLVDIFEVSVGVYAGNLRTTTPAVIPCRKSILSGNAVPIAPVSDAKENISNKVIEITPESTNTQYPSAKAAYEFASDAVEKAHAHNNKGILDKLGEEDGSLEYNGEPVGMSAADRARLDDLEEQVDDLEEIIPSQASSSNQLADKNFVNSSIGTNTAYFRGTFNSLAELEAYSGPLTNNDYAFVIEYDEVVPTQVKVYNRYKYNGTAWAFEYAINNSSFTASQWAAINSGITSTDVQHFPEITANTAARHNHTNKASVLDLLTASDGKLLFNGHDLRNVDIMNTPPSGSDEAGKIKYINYGYSSGLWMNNGTSWIRLSSTSGSKLYFDTNANKLMFSDLIVSTTKPDPFVSLSIRSYPSLVFNTLPKMLSVPFFNADYTGFKVALENEDQTELIQYSDTQDTETGLPVPFLTVRHNGTEYVCWMKDYNGIYGLHGAGWYTVDGGVETACNAPTLANFTPTKFTFCNTSYTANDTIPDNALKALHELSHIVNQSVQAMGSRTVAEDEIVRFKGAIEPNHTYAFATQDDFEVPLPVVEFSEIDRQFVLYIHAVSAIDITFPTGTKFYGGEVPTIEEAGAYKLIGTVEPFGNAWTVGMLTMEAST